jgi:PIN domain nuclease of toxin-antitoxin system
MADRVARLLLDSQVVLWWDTASPALGPEAAKAIRTAGVAYVSAVSEWELAIKAALGKIPLRRTLLDATVDAGFEPLAITFHHVQAVRRLPAIHRDPFDRLLVAVAVVEGLTIVSSDLILARYPVQVIDAHQ